ncbi:hypothetical protein FRC07_002274, partial [Ceratobasidium sp. 392]
MLYICAPKAVYTDYFGGSGVSLYNISLNLGGYRSPGTSVFVIALRIERLQAKIDKAEKERLEAEKIQEERRRQLEAQLAREQEARRQYQVKADQAEKERLAA